MCTTEFLEKVKRTSEAFKARIALPQLENRKDLSNLIGKKTFCKVRRQGDFFSLGEETVSCLRKYIKEISLSIWSFHRNKNSPGYRACNLHINGRKYSLFLR